jgi:hypothetical protein
MVRKCIVCGKEIRISKGKPKFCGMKCKLKYLSSKKEKLSDEIVKLTRMEAEYMALSKSLRKRIQDLNHDLNNVEFSINRIERR